MRFNASSFCSNILLSLLMLSGLTACSTISKNEAQVFPVGRSKQVLIVSVPEQKMLLIEDGNEREVYLISTAKKGIGDIPNSFMTPPGIMEVAEKFGDGLALGSVLKDRVPTGEIVPVESPQRDPIVTRVLWLRGLEESNRNAYERFIYIHGTPQESLLGTPASFGCIRMRSVDIVQLYDKVAPGAKVVVTLSAISAVKAEWIKLSTP